MNVRGLSRGIGLPVGEHRAGRLVRRADHLVADGRRLEAIEFLTAANRRWRNAQIETKLVQLRQEAFFDVAPASRFPTWPPPAVEMFPDVDGIPEIDRASMTVDRVRSGILGHGSIVIRRLLSDTQISTLREGVRSAMAAHTASIDGAPVGETAPWYVPVSPPSAAAGDHGISRQWVRNGGGCLAADSPRALFDLIEVFSASGLTAIVEGYLGERGALSVLKTTLREVQPLSDAGWHQDGAFLGRNIRSINIWLALSPCGVDAPSLDIVPTRLEALAPTGTEGAHFDWSVADAVVREVASDRPPVRLHFEAGDAILFDEMNLHRTAVDPAMTQSRLAIEAWCFAPTGYPLDRYPILL